MLSRTAESLFWLARYMERADSIARKLEVGYRMSMMPNTDGGMSAEWDSLLATTGSKEEFIRGYGEANQENIERYLVFDANNPNSVRNCLRNARNSGREVRTAITTDVWFALNQTWLEFKEMSAGEIELPMLCDWVKRQDATLRGAFINSQLDHDGSDFFNLGYFVERADNTARLLDIKYHVLLPTIEMVGGEVDNYQWKTLLRALSAYRAFHWSYSGDYSPQKISDFLILNAICPRSLRYCLNQIQYRLQRLSDAYGFEGNALSRVNEITQDMSTRSVAGIVQDGLHEYLTQFLLDIAHIASTISDDFLFAER